MRCGPLGLLLVLGACFEDTGNGEGGPFAGPRSGPWLYAEGTPTEDTCMWEDRPAVAAGEFTVTNGEDGTFTILPPMDGTPIECVLAGQEFQCDPAMATSKVPLLDAEFETTSVTSGVFEDREHAEGQYQMAVDCTGTQCATAATAGNLAELPCSYVVPFTAVFVE